MRPLARRQAQGKRTKASTIAEHPVVLNGVSLLVTHSNQVKPPQMEAVPVHLPHWRHRVYAILGLLLVCLVVMAAAATVGSVHIPFLTTVKVLLAKLSFVKITPVWPETTETIILAM